jgi:hypothetical protein
LGVVELIGVWWILHETGYRIIIFENILLARSRLGCSTNSIFFAKKFKSQERFYIENAFIR